MTDLTYGAGRAAVIIAATVLIVPACRDTTDPHAFGSLIFKQLSAGWDQTCGVTTSGAAYCWGSNGAGQLGDSSLTSSAVPVAVVGGLTFASVSAGGGFSCGLTPAGAAYCWGDNWLGELGTGVVDSVPHTTPAAVAGGLTFSTVSAGVDFTCGVTTGGAAYCWGSNWFGELGGGTADTVPHATPAAVSGGLLFTTVSSAMFHSCALTTGGAAYCWGLNQLGTVGDGAVVDNPVTVPAPSLVVGGHTFASISAGSFGTCALAPEGVAWCWGSNENGEMGVDSPWVSSTPLPVSGGHAFSSVSEGDGFTCGVTTDQVAWCWGASALVGKISPNKTCGNTPGGVMCASKEPEPVDGALAVATVSVGREFACGVTTDGAAWCWGSNGAGQLGDGTTTFRQTPVRVAGPR
jgi:alpha-tubulin suppressor-like RCC1 family protein